MNASGRFRHEFVRMSGPLGLHTVRPVPATFLETAMSDYATTFFAGHATHGPGGVLRMTAPIDGPHGGLAARRVAGNTLRAELAPTGPVNQWVAASECSQTAPQKGCIAVKCHPFRLSAYLLGVQSHHQPPPDRVSLWTAYLLLKETQHL